MESNNFDFTKLDFPEWKELTCGLMIRPYITYDETREIVKRLSEIDNQEERDFVLNCTLLNLCCGINQPLDYDILETNNIFDEIRFELGKYITRIQIGVDYCDSIEYNIRKSLDSFIGIADKLEKKFPNKKTTNELVEILKEKVDSGDATNIVSLFSGSGDVNANSNT